uniref:Nuclear receptor domain-containing protein n=1 Tax=Meloidogyne incognita TaxID=6306 RepID=A0A914MDW8_MELIC
MHTTIINMELEQQPQILLPTNIKKRKTIPPELIVDIFKTIGADKYILTAIETDDYIVELLLKDLWSKFAIKLLTCSSIVHLTAGNILRQLKKQKEITYLTKMTAANNPDADKQVAILLVQATGKAKQLLLDEENLQDSDTVDYWVNVFKLAMEKKQRAEEMFHSNTKFYMNEIDVYKAQLANLSSSQTSKIGLDLLTSASTLLNEGIAKLNEARDAFGGGGEPVIGSPTIASKNLCTSTSSKTIGTPKCPSKNLGSPSPKSTTSTSPTKRNVPLGPCPVCKLRDKEVPAYRIFTCCLCKEFFKRVIGRKYLPSVGCGKNCSGKELLDCEACWYSNCLKAGMETSQQSTLKRKLSMDESEKLPKTMKMAESERKSSDDEAVSGETFSQQ